MNAATNPPDPLFARRWIPLWILLAGAAALWMLGLRWADLIPNAGGWAVAKRFFGAAFRPSAVPWADLGEGLWRTVQMAAAGTSLAFLLGMPLGLLGTRAALSDGRPSAIRACGTVCARAIATALRSIHELIWAVIFLAALGLSPLTAVVAIALPYAGAFAKVFSELLEETPRDTAHALRDCGATTAVAVVFGLIPRATSGLLSYTLYRLECGLRSAAVMGFMGIATPGYFIKLAADDTDYGQVWTWLYALLALIAGFDLWSAAIRKRLIPDGHE